ncbi:MAG: hypothetical protein KBA47_03180 [Caldisericia bacterium]|nr:hypothetical protein [Caldisericia bacterium]
MRFGFSEEEFYKLNFKKFYNLLEQYLFDINPNFKEEREEEEFLNEVWDSIRREK